MTSHTARLYGVALALLVFFLTWAAVAARPWATAATTTKTRSPALVALATREQRLRHETIVVNRLVQARWARYRIQLRHRETQIASAHRAQLAAAHQAQVASAQQAQQAQQAQLASAAAPPSVRVVTLPPLTITRTS